MFCVNPECPDLMATGSPGEYVDGITECPVCGAALVAEPEMGGDETGPFSGEELEPVFQTHDSSEVPIVRSLLEGAGIPVHVEGMDRFDAARGGLSPFRFSDRGSRIVFSVPSRLAEDARALLEEVDEGPEGPFCPPKGCGGCSG